MTTLSPELLTSELFKLQYLSQILWMQSIRVRFRWKNSDLSAVDSTGYQQDSILILALNGAIRHVYKGFEANIYQGFDLASSTKGIYKAAIKAEETGLSGVLSETGSKTAAKVGDTILKRGALSMLGETLGLLVPGVDILDFIALAFQIGSVIADLFKDNKYEAWARQSTFYIGNHRE